MKILFFFDGYAMSIVLTDVTLREYGQNVPEGFLHLFNAQRRLELTRLLLETGFRRLEVLSCVSPAVAPAMNKQDVSNIANSLGSPDGVTFVTLVPNEAGYRNFLSLGLGPDGWNHCMGLFFSAVEAHNLANLGKTIDESMQSYDRILMDAARKGIRVAGYVSAAFGFQMRQKSQITEPSITELNNYINFFFERGSEVVTISDLQGVADAQKTAGVIEGVLEGRKGADMDRIGYHPHHIIPEKAVANSLAALKLGIGRFDSSLGGSGGCVTGAPGNQPTELLMEELEKMGINTGIDLKKIKALVRKVTEGLYMKIPTPGGKVAIPA
ncbi:MAG: hypothetical protein COZ70_00875 [Deltaproteobacteria bacterium CG_4_8_14_3_um_filter_51_11]|nr:MAG: hypothetical protein AUK25_07430 [Desulfobacteraceae bacterium CG2_30_51_40]PIX20956.1 MAG: hypothetical protein COZ70_00875 [Deltaproteobacteria bacterium CG_4_8_14_3_um_filter_51_11]PIY26866.1 MAG: hypothetical protein COZ11_01555 [Deltaproteobacteria bacterium CG_4_10_14_3_um_filter_51_14]PJB34443.1 MAG: hypothetical protein CO107_13220 [Deltaproteobacteria bacterium CG_4_9_14_3_um_filter_51_14]